MKKFQLLVIVLSLLIHPTIAGVSCDPDTTLTQPGLYPADSLLPCFEIGTYTDTAIQFRNFDAVDGSVFGFPGITVYIDSIVLLNISNIPAGLMYVCNTAFCNWGNSDNGCISLFGTPTGPAGNYTLGFTAHVWYTIPGVVSGDAVFDSAMVASAGLSYTLRVCQAGGGITADFTYSGQCAGAPTSFNDASIGGPPTSWMWDFGDGSTSSQQNPSHTYANPGNYSVTLRVSDGSSSDSITKQVVIYDSPNVNAGPDIDVCAGSSVTLSATVTGGTPPYGFFWTPGNILNSQTVSNPVATPTSTTTVTVEVTDVNFCRGSDVIILNVLPAPVADAGDDTIICAGDTIQLDGSESSGNNLTFSWNNPSTLDDPTSATPHAWPSTTTTYTLTVTDDNNCVDTDDVTVSVQICDYILTPGMDNSNIRIYPNPAQSEITVTGTRFQQGDIVQLFDMKGKMLISDIVNNDKQVILPVDHLAPGMYLLRNGDRSWKVIIE